MKDQQERPVFGVDIDNVLAYAEREVQRIFTELTKKPWPRSLYASAGGLDGSALDRPLIETIFDYFHDHSISILPIFPGAKLALQRLQEQYRIIIITARRPSSRPQTLAWLRRHQIPFDELYHTDEKVDVPERIVMAVDDHPAHAQGFYEQGIPVFLMDQPWNRGISHPLMVRVTGWDALLQHVHYGNDFCWPTSFSEYPPIRELLRRVAEGASH